MDRDRNSETDLNLYSVTDIFSPLCERLTSGSLIGNFWLGPQNNDPIGFFIIELPKKRFYNIEGVTIRNSVLPDFATKEFEIAFSLCKVDWKTEIQDTFADQRGFDCQNVTELSYNVTTTGRFVRFISLSHYGNQPALSYIDIGYTTTLGFLCPSKFRSRTL